MKSRFCFLFAVFYVTALLIFTVSVRNAEDRLFYELCKMNARQNRLKQQLWKKQLQLESLINPAAVEQRLQR